MQDDALQVLENVQEVRSWGKQNLPLYESVIANDLVIFLAVEFLKNQPLTVKRLFFSLPYSFTAIRQHYKKLCADGWVINISDENDGRIKYIKPSDKFLKVINEYVMTVKKTFTPPPANQLASHRACFRAGIAP